MADNHIQEISCNEIHLDKDKALASVVHDSLHHLFAYFETSTLSYDPLEGENPSFMQATMSSHKASVLLRPPLS